MLGILPICYIPNKCKKYSSLRSAASSRGILEAICILVLNYVTAFKFDGFSLHLLKGTKFSVAPGSQRIGASGPTCVLVSINGPFHAHWVPTVSVAVPSWKIYFCPHRKSFHMAKPFKISG
ncbi:uncharacterized protein LOC110028922 isoform X3 [Phalaenopsis equestris]|uniref:uncharacterized protein LOC110028922 isoform X3 n=1 Tax=Phalaenopsis equestris TaxID=78828 RepID=UPI0009E545BE|nr:uncharacterized protein LOC110028922 isoform X3 [Phalaenopsis equestris]